MDLPSPRIKFIDLPAIDSVAAEKLTVRAELDVAPSDKWLSEFQSVLPFGSELLRQAAVRYVDGHIEFEAIPVTARKLCDEMQALVEITTQRCPESEAP